MFYKWIAIKFLDEKSVLEKKMDEIINENRNLSQQLEKNSQKLQENSDKLEENFEKLEEISKDVQKIKQYTMSDWRIVKS